MFFSKETTPSEKNGTSQNNGRPPVYLTGLNPLSLYLAAKFTAAGQRCIILNDSPACRELCASGLTVKEDRLLQRQKYPLESSFWIRETPEMIVITSTAATLRSDLLLLSPSKIQNTPVVIFSVVEDYEFVKAFLKTPLIQGYFNGYLMQEKSQLTILGRQCSVELVLSADNPFYTRVTGAFQETGSEVKTSDNAAQAFWNNFIPQTVASLLSASTQKNIYNLTKDEQERNLIDKCLHELINLAAGEKIEVDYTFLLKRIYNTPTNYISPLQESLSRKQLGELGSLSSLLLQKAGNDDCKIPDLRGILKNIYTRL